MTALCASSGPSGPKPGVTDTIIVGSFLIDLGLTLFAPELLPFAGLIEAFDYEASSSCATDPPAMPSSADLNPANAIGGVLNPNFSTWLSAVRDALFNYLWSQYCQCTSGAQPTFTYPPPPADVSSPTGGVTSPCSSLSIQTIAENIPGDTSPIAGQTHLLLPNDTPHTSFVLGDQTFTDYVSFAAGKYTSLAVTTTWVGGSVGIYLNRVLIIGYSGAMGSGTQTIDTEVAGCSPSVATTTQVVPIPATTTGLWMGLVNDGGSTAAESIVRVDANCSGTGGTGTGAPAVPDAQTKTMLQTIYQLLSEVYSALPVRVPNYAAAASHTGLSDQGTLSLASTTIAVRVTVNTLPLGYGEIISTPTTFLDIGWITPVTNEGPESGFRLTRAQQVIALPEATSILDYTFPPGALVTIDELEAG